MKLQQQTGLTVFETRFLKTMERARVWHLQLEILSTNDHEYQCDLLDQLRKVTRHAMAAPTLHSKKAYRELSAAYVRTATNANQGRM